MGDARSVDQLAEPQVARHGPPSVGHQPVGHAQFPQKAPIAARLQFRLAGRHDKGFSLVFARSSRRSACTCVKPIFVSFSFFYEHWPPKILDVKCVDDLRELSGGIEQEPKPTIAACSSELRVRLVVARPFDNIADSFRKQHLRGRGRRAALRGHEEVGGAHSRASRLESRRQISFF